MQRFASALATFGLMALLAPPVGAQICPPPPPPPPPCPCPGGGAIAANPGTATWVNTYPQTTNTMNGQNGSISGLGTYTVNMGYTPTGALMYYMPQVGGVPSSVILDFNNGNMGKLNNNVIVAKSVSVPAGKYSVWLGMIYKDTNGNQIGVLSTIFNVEVK